MSKEQKYLNIHRAPYIPAPLLSTRVIYSMSDVIDMMKAGVLKSAAAEVAKRPKWIYSKPFSGSP